MAQLINEESALMVLFDNQEKREKFRALCKELGYTEDVLARRLLQNFITYCEECRHGTAVPTT